jgi:hypothetical protein
MAGSGAAAASGYMLLRRQPRSLFNAGVKRAMLVTHLLYWGLFSFKTNE